MNSPGVKHAAVTLGRHVIVGAGSVILPGAALEDGVAVGALSLISGRCREFGVYLERLQNEYQRGSVTYFH